MSRAMLIALWAFMRAHPRADFDEFAAAAIRSLALELREQDQREQERKHA